jgi:hypothetical protein
MQNRLTEELLAVNGKYDLHLPQKNVIMHSSNSGKLFPLSLLTYIKQLSKSVSCKLICFR